MEDVKQAVMGLSSAEWIGFFRWVNTDEKRRREDLVIGQATAERTIRQLRADGVLPGPVVNEDGTPGEYQPGVVYLPGERVTYDGEVYLSFGEDIIKEPPTDTSRWKVWVDPVVVGGDPVTIYDPREDGGNVFAAHDPAVEEA